MVGHMTRQAFLEEIEAFLARSGMSARKFSAEAARDSGFIYRLRAGQNVTITKIEQVQQFMREHRGRRKKVAHKTKTSNQVEQ
jgi:hypothetical protein